MIFQNCPVSGIWRILNYYEPLLLQNIPYRSYYYLLIMEAEKFAVTHNARSETFISLRLKNKCMQSALAKIFLCPLNEKRNDWHFLLVSLAQTIEGTQHEKLNQSNFQSHLLQSLQRWNGNWTVNIRYMGKLLLVFNCFFVE